MRNNKIFLFFCLFVLAGYFIYGIFYLNIPPVKGDDLWEISRAHFLLKHHHQGDPMFPIEISPYMTSLFNSTVGSEYFGIIKTGSQAFFIALLPIDDIYAFRIASFSWSLLVCFLTCFIAIKNGLNKRMSFFAALLLIIVPEFFSQLHSQRPELMITAAYLLGLLLFLYALEIEDLWKKRILLIICGIYGWLIVITIHPNAVMIPVTFGFIYLFHEYKKLLSVNTLLFIISMIAGFFYFYHLMQSAASQSVIIGGGDLLDITGPPILRRGIKVIISLPLIFYNKFTDSNVFSRPGSLLFFLVSFLSFYYLFKNRKSTFLGRYLNILLIGIMVPLLLLPLFSSSNGHYNIIFLPLSAVIIAGAVTEFRINNPGKNNLEYIFTSLVCLLFLSNFWGMKKQIEFSREFLHIRSELRKTITDTTATIIGSGLFYLDFKEQKYYSSSGMNPRIGRPSQSFEQALSSVQVKYLIVDDGLVYRLYRGRGKEWIDRMFIYISEHCELIKEINTNYWLGHSEGIKAYPLQWRYEGQNGNYLRKIKVYRIIDS